MGGDCTEVLFLALSTGPKSQLQADLWILFGLWDPLCESVKAMKSFFQGEKKVSICMHICTHTNFFLQFLEGPKPCGALLFSLGCGLAFSSTPPGTGMSLLLMAGFPSLGNSECGGSSMHPARQFSLQLLPIGPYSAQNLLNSHSVLDSYQL